MAWPVGDAIGGARDDVGRGAAVQLGLDRDPDLVSNAVLQGAQRKSLLFPIIADRRCESVREADGPDLRGHEGCHAEG